MSTPSLAPARTDTRAAWRHIFAGLCASLVGIGLARFGYTPLIPPLIEAHWFAAADVVTLGAANLAGYLVGALLGRPIAARIGHTATLRWMMVGVTLAFVGCAFPLSLAWFFAWRLVSGVAGGAIMVLVAATVLPHVPPARKGLASGAIFLGVGLGVAASGTLVPLLLHLGLRGTWLGLAVVSGLLAAASWFAWPASGPAHRAAPAPATKPASGDPQLSPGAEPHAAAEYVAVEPLDLAQQAAINRGHRAEHRFAVGLQPALQVGRLLIEPLGPGDFKLH